MATAKTQPKEPEMAVKELSRTEIDLDKMSVEEMLALSAKLAQAAKAQSTKLFDDTMTFLNDKLKAMGRTKFDAMTALYEMMDAQEKAEFTAKFKQVLGLVGTKKPRAAKGTVPKKEVPFVRGTTYKDPAGQGKDWLAGSLGAKPKWITLLTDGLPFEEQKKKYAELAVK